MAKLLEAPTKYTPNEWHRSNHLNYAKSEGERKTGEMIRDESVRLAHETHMTTMKTQNDVNKKIGQRLNDLQFWKSEVDRQYQETDDEIQQLINYKSRLEVALAATDIPLHIAKECLQNREKRISIDLVHDDVEVQLLKVQFCSLCKVCFDCCCKKSCDFSIFDVQFLQLLVKCIARESAIILRGVDPLLLLIFPIYDGQFPPVSKQWMMSLLLQELI